MGSAQFWKHLRTAFPILSNRLQCRVLRKRTYLLGISNVSHTKLGTWDAELTRPDKASVLTELTVMVGKQKR